MKQFLSILCSVAQGSQPCHDEGALCSNSVNNELWHAGAPKDRLPVKVLTKKFQPEEGMANQSQYCY